MKDLFSKWFPFFTSKDIKDFEVNEPIVLVMEETKVEKRNFYKDALTIKRIMLLHPSIRQEALDIYNEICEAVSGKVVVRFTHTLRTIVEQDGLYALGRTLPGKIVTWAKGGFSFHNYGLAIDICLLVDKDNNGTFETASWSTTADFDGDGQNDWSEVVTIFKKHGWEWGGDWGKKDDPHFQKTFGYNTIQLSKMKKDNNGYVIL